MNKKILIVLAFVLTIAISSMAFGDPIPRLEVMGSYWHSAEIAASRDDFVVLSLRSTNNPQTWASFLWHHVPTGRLAFGKMTDSSHLFEQMVITESGNVGIGATSPGFPLVVNGEIAINTDTDRRVAEASAASDELFIGGGFNEVHINGNVGIGTTNPGRRLALDGSMGLSGNILMGGNAFLDGGGNIILIARTLGNQPNDFAISSYSYTHSNWYDRLLINGDNGNVGIGTTNPLQTLDVNGGFTIGNSSRWAMHENLHRLESNKEYILRIPWFNDSAYRTFGFTVTVYGSPASSVDPHGYVRHYFAGYKEDTTNNMVIQGDYAIDLQGNIPNQISFHNISYNPGFIDINFATYGGFGSGRWCTFIIEFYRNADRAATGFTISANGTRSVLYAREKEKLQIGGGYNVGIGTTDPKSKLSVNGTITAKEIKVESGWSDFVFDDDYDLASLDEVESFIRENKHLPDIPSAKEVEQEGLAVSEMLAKQMQKIEELTLYLINIKKENDHLKATIESQNKQLSGLKELRERIEALELKN